MAQLHLPAAPQPPVPFIFDGHPVRVVDVDGDPYFVARDCAEILGYADPPSAISTHCKAPRRVGVSPTLQAHTVIIPERDVYRLVMRSKLPSAEQFEEYVVGTILPAIRKTGSFGVPDFNDPNTLRQLLLQSIDNAIDLQAKVNILAPKADAYDQTSGVTGSMAIRHAAKLIGLSPSGRGPNSIFLKMRAIRWIYKEKHSGPWMPAEPQVTKGHLVLKVKPVNDKDGTPIMREQCRITMLGVRELAKKLGLTFTSSLVTDADFGDDDDK